MKWADLKPHSGIVAALDYAGEPPIHGSQDDKRHWSENFANGCAVALAEALRKTKIARLRNKRILPESLAAGTEPFTPLSAKEGKRIDVTVLDAMLGLEIGLSLKGLNFRDRMGQFDKNITRAMYELSDEVRLVHEFLPNAFMVGICFLPLDAAVDKKSAPTSFARAVLKLRARSGRPEAAISSHAAKCDLAFVGLYGRGDDAGDYGRGIVRFFNVESDPPRRGRPKVEDTLSLEEMVNHIVAVARDEVAAAWGEPEE